MVVGGNTKGPDEPLTAAAEGCFNVCILWAGSEGQVGSGPVGSRVLIESKSL